MYLNCLCLKYVNLFKYFENNFSNQSMGPCSKTLKVNEEKFYNYKPLGNCLDAYVARHYHLSRKFGR